MEKTDNLAELISQLWELGFERPTGIIYSYILINGPVRVEKIKSECDFSEQVVVTALEFLIRLRVIGLDREKSTRMYYAIEPNFAWLTVVADLVWDNRVDIGPIRNLGKTHDLNIERSRIICDKIMLLSQELYRPQTAVTKHKEHDARTSEELAQLICECIYRAKNRIIAVSKTPRQKPVSSFWAVLTDRMSNGISYNRIIDLQEVIDHGLTIVRRDYETYKVGIKVLENKLITHKFYIIDNAYAAIFHNNSKHNNYDAVGRITTKKEIITRYSNRFKELEKSAMPILHVLKVMENAAQKLLHQAQNTLDPLESAWLADLISYGKFSKFHIQEGWTEDKYKTVIDKTIRSNLVVLNQDENCIPNYPVSEENLRDLLKQ